MNSKRCSIIYLCVIGLLFGGICCTLPSCRNQGDNSHRLFYSKAIQDSVEAYLNQLDSVPHPEGNPTITMMSFNRKETTPFLDTDMILLLSYPEYGEIGFDTTMVSLCKGRLNGKLLFIYGNPVCKSLLDWKHFQLSKEDQQLLESKKESLKASEVVDAWLSCRQYKMYSPDSLVLEKSVMNVWNQK